MAPYSSTTKDYQSPSVEDAQQGSSTRKPLRSIPYGHLLLVLDNKDLQNAAIAARPRITKSWLDTELRNATAKDLQTYGKQLSSDDQIKKISRDIWIEYKEEGRKSDEEIANQIRGHKEVLEFFVEYALDQCMLKIETPQRNAREQIERILDVQKEQGDEYQILGIENKIKRSQLTQRRREILSAVHPDKNKDAEANSCTQAINDATDRLLEKGQEFYQPPAGRPKGPKEHLDMFGPGAFGDGKFGSESDDSDEEETVPETEIPDIPDEVRKVHKHIDPYIESYFSTFDEDFPTIPDGVRKANNKIKRYNYKASAPIDIYLVHEAVLYALRQEQLRAIEVRRNKGAEEAEKQLLVLQQMYLNTSRLRKHQWPEGWGAIIKKAVREKLDEINKLESPSDDQGNASDEQADDAFDDTSSLITRGGDNTILPAVRPIQNLRPGWTLLGDKILGYRQMRRFNHYEGQYYTHSAKFFVEAPGTAVFKILSGADIGYHAALAYDRLPDNEKNDVDEYLTGVTNGKISPDAYGGILSLGAKESVYEMTDRLPETWIQIALNGDDDPTKAKIIHRSAFRKLVDNADKLIDSFYVEIGVSPPWATTPYPDPNNTVRYMALQYPAPRRRALEHPERRRLKATPFYRAARSAEYGKANIRSKLETRPYHEEHDSIIDGGGNDMQLMQAIQQLTLVVKNQQEQQQEQRREFREFFSSIRQD